LLRKQLTTLGGYFIFPHPVHYELFIEFLVLTVQHCERPPFLE